MPKPRWHALEEALPPGQIAQFEARVPKDIVPFLERAP